MASIAHLWNPRGNHKLRRHWISFDDRIVIGGECLDQAGVLTVKPACTGELRARLRVMGQEYAEAITAGNDLAIWINGLQLFVGVKAIDGERVLLAFGVEAGSQVNVTLDSGPGLDEDTQPLPMLGRAASEESAPYSIGLRQTRS